MNTHSPLTNSSVGSNILWISFNQDQGCFAIGHENGFLVYNTNPVEVRVKRSFNAGNTTKVAHSNGSGRPPSATSSPKLNPTASPSGTGIGHITMLHRTNYLALVGGGVNPKFPSNKLIIWDDLKRKNSLSLEFATPVLNVLLSRIRIIVVLHNQVLVYGFSAPPKQFATYETIDNEIGLADLSVNSTSSATSITSSPTLSSSSLSKETKYQTLAFPGRSIGQIQLVDVSPQGQEKNSVSIIKAHKTKIRCLALNRSGTLIASASETGTIIRVHSTHNTALLFEFRRGIDKASITSMKFSHNDSKLAVLSDKNTLHIFNLSQEPTSSKSEPMNRYHLLKDLPLPIPIPNYFKSTWSFCSISTNHEVNGSYLYPTTNNDIGTIGWSGNDNVIIIWKNKRLWEKYSLIEKKPSKNDPKLNLTTWELVRSSWKILTL